MSEEHRRDRNAVLPFPDSARAAYYGAGSPIGVYPLDFVLCEQLVSLLKEVYFDCEKNPGEWFPKNAAMSGSFKLLGASRALSDNNET